jgi:hypothetical protein
MWVMLAVSTASGATPSKRLVVTGTVVRTYSLAGPRDGPGPAIRSWGVTVRVEKVKAGKYSRREFFFRTYRAGYTDGHRYTIGATWTADHYEEDESSPIKEEACEVLKLQAPAEQGVAPDDRPRTAARG